MVKVKRAPSKKIPGCTPATKLARTFRTKSMEQSFLHFCQLHSIDPKSTVPFEALAKRIATDEITFIHNVRFEALGADSAIFESELLEIETVEAAPKNGRVRDLPTHLSRLCEARLLSPSDELTLFTRMNYLRFKARRLQIQWSSDLEDCWTVRRIDGLLRAADWYRDTIVKSNMRLVISIVKKFVNPQNTFDDLLSDGIVALMRAVDKFDIELGFRFSTYATQVIRRHTYRLVMDKQNERLKNVGSIHDHGIDISDEERASSMSEQRWTELRSKLSLMLDLLDRREKLIVRARFSLGGHRRVQTLQRLADVLGVSKERIRQLEKRALDKLRTMADRSPLHEIEP